MNALKHYLAFMASIFLPLFIVMGISIAVTPNYTHNDILSYAKVFWFTGILFVLTNAIGFFYGNPWTKEQELRKEWREWTTKKRLIVAYVSRGNNEIALQRAIAATKLVLETAGVNYRIEAITDMPVNVGADDYYLVPKEYHTPNGAKYKARALHYAAEKRPADQHTWILHLDEESVITEELVHGIDKFLRSTNKLAVIGQGEIKYNAHNYGKNLLITSVDSIRTGDDLGRFRTQYRLFGKPLFGMHGSFFLVNSLLERKIGFDLGGKGSITEDAYFALVCADKGVKFKWVQGYIREQSPFTIIELLKQRRRWITGLRLLMWDRTISARQRVFLGFNMLLWRLAWVGPIVTIANFLLGGSAIPAWAELTAGLTSGMVASVYMVGAYRNITNVEIHPLKKLIIWVASGVLMPISCAIEGVAVLYSIIAPVKNTFEVVDKN